MVTPLFQSDALIDIIISFRKWAIPLGIIIIFIIVLQWIKSIRKRDTNEGLINILKSRR